MLCRFYNIGSCPWLKPNIALGSGVVVALKNLVVDDLIMITRKLKVKPKILQGVNVIITTYVCTYIGIFGGLG
jgi:hypothetical protein